MEEPFWRKALCWGSVGIFLVLPLVIFSARLFGVPNIAETVDASKFLLPYFQSITALVFGLAGLNTWDRRLAANGKQQPKKEIAK
jgi:hypothetical protein